LEKKEGGGGALSRGEEGARGGKIPKPGREDVLFSFISEKGRERFFREDLPF